VPEDIALDQPLMEIGMDSLAVVGFRNALASSLEDEVTLQDTLVFDYPTIEAIASYLHKLHNQVHAPSISSGPLAEIDRSSRQAKQSTLGLISSSFQLPNGLSSDADLFSLLSSGGCAITELPAGRWDIDALSGEGLSSKALDSTKYGGFVPNIEYFDAPRFGLSRTEASVMDPQQRMLLESAYDAFCRAGQTKATLEGRLIGVYVGIQATDFGDLVQDQKPLRESVYAATGSNHAVASGRISYILGLRGACMSINTACSSSLVAMHEARLGMLCQNEHDTHELALVASVNLMLVPAPTIMTARAGMLSPRGRCHTFDHRADGYVRAEGSGAFVLGHGDGKLLVSGSAVRSDGKSASLTAPNGVAQYDLIAHTLRVASNCIYNTTRATLGYVETHGTGTALGDPVEVGALTRIATEHRRSIVLSGVKGNLGHLEPAAGFAGIASLLIAMRKSVAIGNAQLHRLNPRLLAAVPDLSMPCSVCPHISEATDVGSSSFGYSGTIAHFVARSQSEHFSGIKKMASQSISDSTKKALSVKLRSNPILHRCKGFATDTAVLTRIVPNSEPVDKMANIKELKKSKQHFPWRSMPEPLHDMLYNIAWEPIRDPECGERHDLDMDYIVMFSWAPDFSGVGATLRRSCARQCDRPVTVVFVWKLHDGILDIVHSAMALLSQVNGAVPMIWLTAECLHTTPVVQHSNENFLWALWGLARAARAEQPNLQLSCIDPGTLSGTELMESITASVSRGPEVVCDTENNYTPHLVQLPAKDALHFRLQGTSLITGGTGSVGRAVVSWIAACGATAAILMTPSGRLPPDLCAPPGIKLMAVASNDCNFGSTKASLDGIAGLCGVDRINNVILTDHLSNSGQESLRAVLASKVQLYFIVIYRDCIDAFNKDVPCRLIPAAIFSSLSECCRKWTIS
jgi:3-oxoacyl-(acyl-carrier-protein) synthase